MNALEDRSYYQQRRTETHALRYALQVGLAQLGWDVIPGVANFLLCHLPEDGPTALVLARRAKERGLLVREVGSIRSATGPHSIRVAVKDAPTNARVLEILAAVSF